MKPQILDQLLTLQHICIYVYAMSLGFGPVLAILKVRIWTKLSDRFWTKVMLAYFYMGFGQFMCAKVSVVCFWFCLVVVSQFCKMALFEGSERKYF